MKPTPIDATRPSSAPSHLTRIAESIHDAAAWLPRQGPITKFAFLNPLQGLEHEHYDEVMRKVGRWYGNEAYLDDSRYRQKLWRGRITESDLRDVLAEDLGTQAEDRVAGLTSRLELRLATLIYPLHFGHRRELAWVVAETDAVQQFRPEVSQATKLRLTQQHQHWVVQAGHGDAVAMVAERAGGFQGDCDRVSRESLVQAVPAAAWESIYLRTLWRMIHRGVDGEDFQQPARVDLTAALSDSGVDELMIRFTSAYLDQGYASTPLPGAELGYWEKFRLLYSRPSMLAPRWRRSLAQELQAIEQAGWKPLEVIQASLDRLGVSPNQVDECIRAALLSLRGFAGMIWQSEIRPDLFRKPSPPGTLIEFLAVRLLLLRMASEQRRGDAVNQLAENSEHRQPPTRDHATAEQLAFMLFELAQVLQWSPETLSGLSGDQWRELSVELQTFCDHQRRRIFHAAFERRIAKSALSAVAVRAAAPAVRPSSPSLQVVCCLDAREESLRRHLEELDPAVETYGIAGFFGVAMYYRGVGDADFSALCPIVMKPQHWVIEEAVYSLEESDRARAWARRWIGIAQRRFQTHSRRLLGGAVVSTLVGPLATIPMLSRILLPRLTALMHRTARQFIAPPTITRLRLERSPQYPPAAITRARAAALRQEDPGKAQGDSAAPLGDEGLGFTPDEMTRIAERALRDIGLTSRFAPLVLLLGHGSQCVNNPHESAYHCGACAGNAGGPGARALAMMLNDSRVRRNLAAGGLLIPEETYFIGGQHNTATEEMMFYDLELLPTTKIKRVRGVAQLFAEAARRNAHERCRRFESAAFDLTPEQALLHVQDRSEDLAQTRPEYGNGSNAICFVGRRERIRGLYLDRRSFLMSYDPSQDNAEAAILARILAAVVPVCQGINLLYSLSAIDPGGWGSGTKLPHNITSLVGVMDGAASDLRPGLPWQGVDIHEPVRLLFIIEATPHGILKIMAENPAIDQIFRNHWAHVAVLDPDSAQMHRFSKDRFVPFDPESCDGFVGSLATADGSLNWYRGHRDHLPFAITTPQEQRVGERQAAAAGRTAAVTR